MTRSVSQPRRNLCRSVVPCLEFLEDRTVPSTLQGAVTPGVFDPGTGTWYLHNSNKEGPPDAGTFRYGSPGWVGITGDWTGTGKSGIGAFDPNTATWYLRSQANAGAPDVGVFQFGGHGWVPLVGDWTGSGHVGIGAFDPSTATFYLRNELSAGAPDAGVFQYGGVGWLPVVGDWADQGKDGIGVFDPNTANWYLRNEANAGAPDAGTFAFGGRGWRPLAGDWGGRGRDGIGAFDPATGTWYLRGSDDAGAPDEGQFAYGSAGWQPVPGTFTDAPKALFPLTITGVTLQNGQLVASGTLGDPTPLTLPITLSAAKNAADPSAPILNLMLGPIHLNVLGLKVDTSPICLSITAQQGPGNLLGNLLYNIANSLNNGQSQASVLNGLSAADLNTLTTGVTSLLNSTGNSITSLAGTTPSATPGNTTNVLTLSLGPVNLNLLGLLVKLDNCANGPVTVSVTAQSGPGNLLGNLIGDLAHLLDNNAANAAVNRLLALIARDLATLI